MFVFSQKKRRAAHSGEFWQSQLLIHNAKDGNPARFSGRHQYNDHDATGLLSGREYASGIQQTQRICLCPFFFRKEMLLENTFIRPNFWRAPTDNDFGASLQIKYAAWQDPVMEFKGFSKEENELCALYELPQLNAKLLMKYSVDPRGGLRITQELKTGVLQDEDRDMPPMFRFGIRFFTPKQYNRLVYYGRGPGENYPDRKDASFVGLYRQGVEEQFYPYIRPQEKGARTDLRWWQLLATGDQASGWTRIPSFPPRPSLFTELDAVVSTTHSLDRR
jgi:beta-galactosidase/beta-glucuronidase